MSEWVELSNKKSYKFDKGYELGLNRIIEVYEDEYEKQFGRERFLSWR